MKNSKRRIVIFIAIVLFVISLIGEYYSSNHTKYEMYCQDECNDKFVTGKELDRTESDRKLSAEETIADDLDEIKSIKNFLSDKDLTAELQMRYDNAVEYQVYDDSADYSVAELIDLESEYNDTLEELQSIKHEFYKGIRITKIEDIDDEINTYKSKLTIPGNTLSVTQELSELNADYDELVAKGYSDNLDDLKELEQEYRDLEQKYESLYNETI